MGRKRGIDTKFKKEPLMPVYKFMVCFGTENQSVVVSANDVEDSGDLLIFKIIYTHWVGEHEEDYTEIVAMFKEWSYFKRCDD